MRSDDTDMKSDDFMRHHDSRINVERTTRNQSPDGKSESPIEEGVDLVDVNKSDDITDEQYTKIQQLLNQFPETFEDAGTVAPELQQDWTRIELRRDVKLESKGPYNLSKSNGEVVDKTFDKYHRDQKMLWTNGVAPVAWPVFVIWQHGKDRVMVNI
ncbi:hypothetical protein EDC01DRAFT_776555 [Geopyxis carbonaria]|nr:hypothetical protein EDC01DRAFT_776555 [Geopyxis carbonaria]